MRLYSFVNRYLSDIQKGIQTAHLVGELAAKYCNDAMFEEWRDEHKTIIVLDGGDCIKLYDIFKFLSASNPDEMYRYLVGCFYEDESLEGALTCVGIIAPIYFYNDEEFEACRMSLDWIDLRIRELIVNGVLA
jgi:hypothetical protein